MKKVHPIVAFKTLFWRTLKIVEQFFSLPKTFEFISHCLWKLPKMSQLNSVVFCMYYWKIKSLNFRAKNCQNYTQIWIFGGKT